MAANFLLHQPMIVIGAAADDGSLWASLLAGREGFVTAIDDRTIVVDALPGMFDPLSELFDVEREIGILAIDLGTRRRMRINGRAHTVGAQLVVQTDQVYANCPKYIQVRGVSRTECFDPQVHRTKLLTDRQRTRITEADTFFIATSATGLGADVSHRGGNPGFVTVSSSRRLSWPDYSGNMMYMTHGNLELDARCGLLFPDWERGGALHITGRAYVDWDRSRADAVPGAQQMVDFDVEQVIQVDEAYALHWSFGEYSRFNPPSVLEPSSP
ncbi:pyridoxamine 5'-phosphate oxidase family protein [Rhodococcus sp. JVH1]|uniref:pyridoxamine 5'-phosphate oxidase family protein n=1 Tax=Rhodococcus sp. JVH1 TaxID=745408 RepID=UPI001ED98343|nr:pyridoxamine 5'-phosphate oxidase family protein [Rhodococcus sp. JVH1]